MRNPYLDNYIRVKTLRPNDHPRDPLNRKPGESLDPKRFTAEQLERKRRTLGTRMWGAVWMQDPQVQGGGIIHRSMFQDPNPARRRILPPEQFQRMTEGLLWVRGYDFAWSEREYNKPNPDYTVGAKVAARIDDDLGQVELFLAHITRYQEQTSEIQRRVVAQAMEDGRNCYIAGEANGPQKGAVSTIFSLPALFPYVKYAIPGDGVNKTDRAQNWASVAQQRNMWIQEGEWNAAFFDEIDAFPNGSKDDIVDACSIASLLAFYRARGLELGTEQEAQTEQVALYGGW